MPNNRDNSINIANWTSHADATPIGLLHEDVRKGKTQTSTFKEKRWAEFETKLFGLLGQRFFVKQLKSKFNHL